MWSYVNFHETITNIITLLFHASCYVFIWSMITWGYMENWRIVRFDEKLLPHLFIHPNRSNVNHRILPNRVITRLSDMATNKTSDRAKRNLNQMRGQTSCQHMLGHQVMTTLWGDKEDVGYSIDENRYRLLKKTTMERATILSDADKYANSKSRLAP